MRQRSSLMWATGLVTLSLIACQLPPAFAQGTKKSPAKAVPKKPAVKAVQKTGVKAATQMAGDNGQIGQTYMIGAKDNELVFTLTGAEYAVSRVAVGVDSFESAVPHGDEKVLLVRYSVQNPQKGDMDFNRESFLITAVDAKDVNHAASFVGRQGTNEPVSLQLKPAQKLDVFTAIVVPATGPVPKLIIQRGEGTAVLRYDLRGKVKSLAVPFADAADTTGASARATVSGITGTFYPLMAADVKLDGTGFASGSLEEQEAEEGKHFFTATVTLKNNGIAPMEYGGGMLKAELTLASGEKVPVNDALLHATRTDAVRGTLKPGETATVRLYVAVPADDKPKTLQIQEGEESRAYLFDVSATK